MTIAMCHLSTEGVVFGADSTSSSPISPGPGQIGFHYFNYAQKLFELGGEPQTGTLGILTWNLGGLPDKSHRTLFALLSDDIRAKPPSSVKDVADRWAALFWQAYSTGGFAAHI